MYTIIAKKDTGLTKKDRIYYCAQSSFMGGCYHIYVAYNDKDSWLFNLFSKKEFNEWFKISD